MTHNTYDDVRAILNHPAFTAALESIGARVGSRVEPGGDLSMILSFLETAEVGADELRETLDSGSGPDIAPELDLLIDWCVRTWRFLEREPDVQEYPAGEGPGETDDVLDSWIDGLYLAGRLCEFVLLTRRDDAALLAYLRKQRVPGSVRHAKDLRRLLTESQRAA